MITDTALCGLGKTAASPVLSTLKHFLPEYEAHINEKRCPAGSCSALADIIIKADACKSCGKCVKVCPADAISGKPKEPYAIDAGRCIKCEACIGECPFNAITKG
jgi:NADP-reducing hydrogenase subunit HndC